MIGQTVDAGDHFKKRAAIPLAPCTLPLRVPMPLETGMQWQPVHFFVWTGTGTNFVLCTQGKFYLWDWLFTNKTMHKFYWCLLAFCSQGTKVCNTTLGNAASISPEDALSSLSQVSTLWITIQYTLVLGIKIQFGRIRMFLGLPDPLVRGTDPDSSLFS